MKELSMEQVEQVIQGFDMIMQAVGARKLSDVLNKEVMSQLQGVDPGIYQSAYDQIRKNIANTMANSMDKNQDMYIQQLEALLAKTEKK